MGVVTISSSASRASFGLSRRITLQQANVKAPYILGFKSDKTKKISLVGPSEPVCLHIEKKKDNQKKGRSVRKPSKARVGAASVAEASTFGSELDLNEAAAKLESIFKLSPSIDFVDEENIDHEVDEKLVRRNNGGVVRNRKRKAKRLNLDKRIEMKKNKESKTKEEVKTDKEEMKVSRLQKMKPSINKDEKTKEEAKTDKGEMQVSRMQKMKPSVNKDEKIKELVRQYSASTDLGSLDWKKMKIPPVLPSSEHTWLFKLLETRKVTYFLPFIFVLKYFLHLNLSL